MPRIAESWLALDVGGANLKGAHSSGVARSRAFALWRQPDALASEIATFATTFPPFKCVALTMTAELCDCFETKRAGVRFILDAVSTALPGRSVRVWGLDGAFHDPEEIRDATALAAAANWLALSTVAAEVAGEGHGILIDVGSTTSDLIPLKDGQPVPAGRTDTERLQSGELVYVGVRRTPICALAPSLPVRGRATRLAAELFATTLDVFLTLGAIPEDPTDLDTADGRPATRACARARLARMVGADRDGFSEEDAHEFALAARREILERLTPSMRTTVNLRPTTAIVSGSGEFLAHALAERIVGLEGRVLSLATHWGPAASAAACAYALLRLTARED